MATNLSSKRTLPAEFYDVSLGSDSVSTDGSYDFAEDSTSDDGEVIAKQEAPRSNTRIASVAVDSSLNASKRNESKEERHEKENKTVEWPQESQMTAGDSEVSSVASDDSMPMSDDAALEVASISENDLQGRLEKAELQIGENKKTIQKLMDDDAEYMALFEKKHQEEVEQHEKLKKEHEESVEAAVAWIEHLNKKHEEKIQTTKADYEAIVVKKDKELTSYQEAISDLQRRYDNHLAALIKKHESDMHKTTDGFQSLIADMIQKQNESAAEISKLKEMEKKYKQDIQKRYLNALEYQCREAVYESRLNGLFVENKNLKQSADFAQIHFTEQRRQINDLRELLQGPGNPNSAHRKSQASYAVAQISNLNAELFAANSKADTYRKENEAAYSQILAMRKELGSLVQRLTQHSQQWPQQPISAPALAKTTAKQAATMLEAHQIASQANDVEILYTGVDRELHTFNRITRNRSHEQQLNEADNIIEKVQKQKEQLNASEAKVAQLEDILAKVQKAIFTKEDKLKQEFEVRDAREEALKKDAASARATIARLEKDLDRVEGENFNLQFEVLEAEEKVKLGEAVQGKCAEFVDQLYDLRDELDRVEEITNDYADDILSGDKTDLQAVWDKALTEMNRIVHEPFELLESLMENLEKLGEKDDGEAEEDDKSDEEEGGVDLDYSATNTEAMAPEVNHLRNKTQSVLEDNQKLNLTLAKANESATNREAPSEEVKNLRNTLETILEDNRKLVDAIARADQGHVNALTELQHMSAEYYELEEEVKKLKETAESFKFREQVEELKSSHIQACEKDLAIMGCKLIKALAQKHDAEEKYAELQAEFLIAENDIEELQMVVHHAEQRAASAEAELRGIGQDVEEYLKQHGVRDLDVESDRVKGRGAGKAVEEVFGLLGWDWEKTSMQYSKLKAAEEKLRAMEEDLEDLTIGF